MKDAWKLAYPRVRHIHDDDGRCLTYGDACEAELAGPGPAAHCYTEHALSTEFAPAAGVTWDQVHHLLHRLSKWGKNP